MSPTPRLPLHPPGQPFAIEQYGLVAKPYSCCGYVQRLVAAAVDIGARAGFEANRIKTIAITAPKRNAEVVNHGIPDSIDAARFSAVYCVAASLLQGSLGPEDFTESAIQREQVLDLVSRTTFSPDEKLQGPDDLSPEDPDRLVITMAGGEVIDLTLSILPGGKDAPLTPVQMRAKFDSCARKRLTADEAGKLEAVLSRFEDLKDISSLPTLMGLA